MPPSGAAKVPLSGYELMNRRQADVLLSFGINRGVCRSGIKRCKVSCPMSMPGLEGEVVYSVEKEKWYMDGVEGCPADVRNQSRCRHKQKAGKCSTAGV